MKGKDKCRVLKEIRDRIAKENAIPYEVSECSHKGDCSGTCPKCESEVRYLERELEKRRSVGKKIALLGVATGIALTSSACAPLVEEQLEGDMQVSPPGELEGEEVVDVLGDLAPEDDIPFINEDGEEDVLMGEPTDYVVGGVLPAHFIADDISEYDIYDESFIEASLMGENIEDILSRWGEPDFKQSAKEESVYSYFGDVRDIKITFDSETGEITKVETIDA